MFNITFKERMIIVLLCTIFLALVYLIIAIFSFTIRESYLSFVISAFAGGFVYQVIDWSIYKYKHRKDEVSNSGK